MFSLFGIFHLFLNYHWQRRREGGKERRRQERKEGKKEGCEGGREEEFRLKGVRLKGVVQNTSIMHL